MRALNPHLFIGVPHGDVIAELVKSDLKELAGSEKKAGKRRSAMNKTEARFARLLEARVERGEIISFEYEGITLRWPDGMRYSPDFVLWVSTTGINDHLYTAQTLVEVKGAHAWAKDVVKFRAARDRWGNRYRFEFWQEVDGQWTETR